jgi:hypothetical protein
MDTAAGIGCGVSGVEWNEGVKSAGNMCWECNIGKLKVCGHAQLTADNTKTTEGAQSINIHQQTYTTLICASSTSL